MITRNIADLLAAGGITRDQIVGLIGRPVRAELHGYRLAPFDSDYESAYLAVDRDTDGRERPTYVELVVSPGTRLRLSQLSDVFGRWVPMPAVPEGGVFNVRFELTDPNQSFDVSVFVDLHDTPGPTSLVERILVRRDKRL